MAIIQQRRYLDYCDATGLGPGYKPRLTRAYAEGRVAANATDNPEDTKGTALEKAWDQGFTNKASADYKYSCAS